MKQIASFTIDHMKLLCGVYVSRKDKIGNEVITTFDIRVTRPNFEPVMMSGEIHTIEHLGATYLRNHKDIADKVIYFGPMGCRTGFYLLLGGDYESKDILPLLTEMFEFIRDFEGEIPGATAINCGNYSDMNLELAKHYANRFLTDVLYVIDEEHLIYPV
ncbi:MAG: luxS [Herbinix sp.]|jgi:S-ribosylhomocysteine lyase|nr:luxS [Herbinix sp.]